MVQYRHSQYLPDNCHKSNSSGVQELHIVAFKSYAKVIGSELVMLIILGYSTCILHKEEQIISWMNEWIN